jgi:hypothetical protein
MGRQIVHFWDVCCVRFSGASLNTSDPYYGIGRIFSGLAFVRLGPAFGPFLASKIGMNDTGQATQWGLNTQEGTEMQHGNFLAMIQKDGGVFRFVIRDRSGLKPSIHGYGTSMNEAESKIDEILGALDELEQAA